MRMDRDANDKTINELNEDIGCLKTEFEEKNKDLAAQKDEIERRANEDQAYLRRKHDDEKRKQKQEFQERLMSDTARYDQLMEQKELQKHAYEKQINELYLNQSKAKEKLL